MAPEMTQYAHVSQSTHDKVLQIRPWCCLRGSSYRKKYALHIKYRKLNLIGHYGVDKEV